VRLPLSIDGCDCRGVRLIALTGVNAFEAI
jgi:hypothetical protein